MDVTATVFQNPENENEFARLAAPSAWLDVAQELREAAEELRTSNGHGPRITINSNDLDGETGRFEKPAHSRAWVLLAGYSLENAFKGLRVLREPSLVYGNKLTGDLMTSHSLLDLARSCNLSLTEDDERLLKLATEAIPYWGRYPIPKKAELLSAEIAQDDKMHEAFNRLFVTVETEIKTEMPNGWPLPDGTKFTTDWHVRDETGNYVPWTPA